MGAAHRSSVTVASEPFGPAGVAARAGSAAADCGARTSTMTPIPERRAMTDPSLLVRFTEQAQRTSCGPTRGLTSDPKWLSPKWFYDATGAILRAHHSTAGYYQTQRRAADLQQHAMDIAELTKAAALCELGAGSPRRPAPAQRPHRSWNPAAVHPAGRFPGSAAETVAAIAADYGGGHRDRTIHPGTAELRIAPPGVLTFLGGTIGTRCPRAGRVLRRSTRRWPRGNGCCWERTWSRPRTGW